MKPVLLVANLVVVMAGVILLDQTAPRAVAYNLVPLPASMITLPGKMPINKNFNVHLTGYSEPRLKRAIERLKVALSEQTGLPLTNQEDSWDQQVILTIQCDHASASVQGIADDESYKLIVTTDQAQLTAPTPLGVLRGLETFRQLVERDQQGFAVSAMVITDHPRFPWRGLLIDSARHWMPVDVIKQNLDQMSAVKMNVFHWHLSDDQGFRVESKAYPLLQKLGSDGDFYTQAQIKDIVEYARDRGIRVIPEFDIPGHSTSWFVGYPDLAGAPGPYSLARSWGIKDPVFDPTRETTYQFLDVFIGEMAGLFPDTFFHIGGDEVNGKQWNASASIQAYKSQHGMSSNAQLQAYFNQRIDTILGKYGKTMIGWDEVLTPGIPSDVIIHSWRGQKSLVQAVAQGHRAILSSGYYVDNDRGLFTLYQNDPLEGAAATLSDDQRKLILGGEACAWTEHITAKQIVANLWPRTGAVAERLWSPEADKDDASLFHRLGYDAPSKKKSTPFNGTPHTIPGTIQVEDFDNGGEGVGYLSFVQSNAGKYRPKEGVEIENCADTGGGHNVGYIAQGQWLNYTVDIAHAGTYTVASRVASGLDNGGSFHLEDEHDRNLTGSIAVPTTGGWQKWTTVTTKAVLPAGKHVLTLVEDTNGYNLNWVTFTAVEQPKANEQP